MSSSTASWSPGLNLMPEAVWFGGPQQVEIREEPLAPVGPDDVRIRSLVSGVSAGSELLVYRGDAPRDLPPDLPTVGGDFGFPIKFAYANVGRVIEVGSRVSRLAVDDLVFVHHPHQTEYVVPGDAPIRLPEGLPPDVGVFAANLETALTVVLDAHPRLGEAVLVCGQGVVGLLITMLLRRAGASPIVTADLHERRRTASASAGADHVLPVDAGLVDAVLELTEGRGVDVAVEASGNPVGLQDCIDATAFAGRVVVASWYGSRDVSLNLGGRFHRGRTRIMSSQVSTLDPALAPRWDRARRSSLVSALLQELPLDPLITHRFPLSQAAAAYELLDREAGECLQVVLDYV
jgi:2-desacetyl-2-hydroxyethyl bacteriochlorophyllide A dehydrogenase